jgi:hypothetical protein
VFFNLCCYNQFVNYMSTTLVAILFLSVHPLFYLNMYCHGGYFISLCSSIILLKHVLPLHIKGVKGIMNKVSSLHHTHAFTHLAHILLLFS